MNETEQQRDFRFRELVSGYYYHFDMTHDDAIEKAKADFIKESIEIILEDKDNDENV